MLMPSIFNTNLFDDFFDFPFYDDTKAEKKLYGHHAANLMKTDVQETDNSYLLEMDLPGFTKDEVKVSLKDGYLTISAEKGLDEDKEDKSAKYIRKERYAGACERSFYVGEDVEQNDIKGEFKHGILKLTIPKVQPHKEIDTTKYIELD